ncbi:hypothetical protein GCM10010193_57900 [Kitasatospora atroaurantiaca]|uniref:Uncharacterized protein n=1 Tax=Kitasatospora atroaurantiaca TaxID=285545 RepID=A0A561EI63_9ACTN|nr:hypothetical protein [Kitasatospora atroaurantiaca]TWE15301.1 hypothetical protein FB465_0189 [Kitasatospora atroaurantiaca]
MPPANGYSHVVVASWPLIAISGQASSLVQGSVLAPRFRVEVDALAVLAEP